MQHGILFNHSDNNVITACQLPEEQYKSVFFDTMQEIKDSDTGKVSEKIEICLKNLPDEVTKSESFIYGFLLGRAIEARMNPLHLFRGLL